MDSICFHAEYLFSVVMAPVVCDSILEKEAKGGNYFYGGPPENDSRSRVTFQTFSFFPILIGEYE